MSKCYWQNMRWLAIAVLVMLLDQFTKHIVLQTFTFGESKPLLPVLNFTLTFNQGAAFAFLGNAGSWTAYFFTALSLTICGFLVGWLCRLTPTHKIQPMAICCIIGGALSNVWDRVQLGMVVDFIHVHWQQYHFPVFNVADSAIFIGAMLILLCTWREA